MCSVLPSTKIKLSKMGENLMFINQTITPTIWYYSCTASNTVAVLQEDTVQFFQRSLGLYAAPSGHKPKQFFKELCLTAPSGGAVLPTRIYFLKFMYKCPKNHGRGILVRTNGSRNCSGHGGTSSQAESVVTKWRPRDQSSTYAQSLSVNHGPVREPLLLII